MKKTFRDTHITISGWMVSELGLNGNQLLVFALIYGFSQDGQSEFYGSISYIKRWLNASEPTVISAAKSLVDAGLVQKRQVEIDKVLRNYYAVNWDGVERMASKISLEGALKKFEGGSKEILDGGSKEILDNNTILDNTINNLINKEPNGSNTLFPEPEKLKRKKAPSAKTLFKTTFPEDGGFEKFCAAFENSEYAQNFDASLRYYFEAVRDWSAANNTTKADWIATARNFMRGDLAKNKLVTNAKLTNQHRPTGGVDFELARRATSEFLAKRGIQA